MIAFFVGFVLGAVAALVGVAIWLSAAGGPWGRL